MSFNGGEEKFRVPVGQIMKNPDDDDDDVCSMQISFIQSPYSALRPTLPTTPEWKDAGINTAGRLSRMIKFPALPIYVRPSSITFEKAKNFHLQKLSGLWTCPKEKEFPSFQ